MRKFITLIGAVLLGLSANALTIPVWQGSQAFSGWAQSINVRSDIYSQLAVGDRLVIHVTAVEDGWTPIVLRKTAETSVNQQFNVSATGNFIISFTSDLVSKFSAGFDVTGDKVTIDRIDYIKLNSNESETLWSVGEAVAFSWGNYAEQGDEIGRLLAVGDRLVVHITAKNGDWPKILIKNASGDVSTLEIFNMTSTYPYDAVVTLDADLVSALADGFYLSGCDLSANSLTLIKAPQSGDERVIWEGSESLTWGTGVATQDAVFSSALAHGDQIIVTVDSKESTEWPKVYVLGQDGELGTVLVNKVSSFPYQAKITLTSTILSAMKDGKLSISGSDVTISKVVLHKDAFYNPAKETTLWSGSVTNIYWSGNQPNTKNDLSISFANARIGDVIKVYVGENTTADAKWEMKNTSSWAVITNASGAVNKYGYFTYVIPDEAIAADIRENGFILSGEGTYEAIQIALVKAERMDVEDIYDPSLALSLHTGALDNFTLKRTIYCDGYYNTICLPFSLATLEGTPLEDATVMQLNSASINAERDELTLMVLPVTSMNAGQPYLISFPEGEDITSMTFRNVNISAPTPQTVDKQALKMVGIYAPTNLTETYYMLFLGEENTLYWSDATESLKGFRAYFDTNVGAGAPRRGITAKIVKQENVASDLQSVNATNVEKKIVDGQLVIIRNGVQYTILGNK